MNADMSTQLQREQTGTDKAAGGKRTAVFMGTPDFATASLQALIDGGYALQAVFTQPDKPKGRSGKLQPPPVKELALSYGIPVYQPRKIREPDNLRILEELNPDVIVVAAYGQIIPKQILQLPRFGCVNVHASLLPAYRGAAPIQWAILDGEERTGVTIMQMNEGLDTGDILTVREIPIGEKETGGSLFDKLAQAGAELLVSTLEKLGTDYWAYTKSIFNPAVIWHCRNDCLTRN